MKTKGSNTYIGVPLKDLNRIFGEDAIIPCSKKGLNAYLMAAGLDETLEIVTLSSKPISLNIVDNTQKTEIKPEPKEEASQHIPEWPEEGAAHPLEGMGLTAIEDIELDEEKKKETVYVPMPTPEEKEMAPPLDINISDGDW